MATDTKAAGDRAAPTAPDATPDVRRRRVQAAKARSASGRRARELSRRSEEVERLIAERVQRFAEFEDARERALISLYADHLLAEGAIRLTTGWSHWDFLAMLARFPDLAHPDDAYYAALGALEPR